MKKRVDSHSFSILFPVKRFLSSGAVNETREGGQSLDIRKAHMAAIDPE